MAGRYADRRSRCRVCNVARESRSRGRDLPLLYDYFTALPRLDVAGIAAKKRRGFARRRGKRAEDDRLRRIGRSAGQSISRHGKVHSNGGSNGDKMFPWVNYVIQGSSYEIVWLSEAEIRTQSAIEVIMF